MSEEIISPSELEEELRKCPEWEIKGSKIIRELEFEEFMDAIDFVNLIAEAAEDASHHPDIDIRYNKVKLALTTHEIGGVTEADLEMAIRIDNICDE
ncbi:4a-hydroxytetrahydrobiopterin dehydratase [Rubritalea squalenifaciens DSM 18772]|uniref:Putative pterin-4-alpha-carbinolamine dehydratase n=2 Tax=Rubritalea TaxID=361050 RepID=A0A1M6MG95_9BACT|nr:4a-hydroxytetrahydrobiopterin dehydratase [Rubritalea squalenifaciens]SHJ82491.1 4a-hydroxytetrahydrobiopterin dehydratase [Rubritalea squalenifaciens DSM 18772]